MTGQADSRPNDRLKTHMKGVQHVCCNPAGPNFYAAVKGYA